jgi:2-polyprenyl-3-methyl-5-hydroxy-6-metoxy-1,4-benzoquinol methylase
MPTLTPPIEGAAPTYWLNQGDAESQRLVRQGRIANPVTREVFRAAGIAPGMKVLDIGTGPGDLGLVAADIVGPQGHVTGVDRNADVLSTARSRAVASNTEHVTFIQGDALTFAPDERYEAVVGRAVLVYVADPVATLRNLVGLLAPGGIVAFQEYNFEANTIRTEPPMPTWLQVAGWVERLARTSGLGLTMGFDLHRVFVEAGLLAPRMRIDAEVSGAPDWDGFGYLAETLRSMLPRIFEAGIATPEEVDIETLADHLRADVLDAQGVATTPDLVSA